METIGDAIRSATESLTAKDADESTIRSVVQWGVAHSTVSDATTRAVPMTLEIEPAS